MHAKIGIVDDRWFTIGSANLNDHSLFNDTEMNLVCQDPRVARAARLRLWSEHLECSAEQLERPAAEVVDGLWRTRADDPAARLTWLPHVSRRSRRLLGPLNGVLVDG